MAKPKHNTYFSDVFGVSPKLLQKYGALNISLVADIPLFIDPFLLFNSKKPVYRQLHEQIVDYLKFLRDKSRQGSMEEGLLYSLFMFREVKQTWLGFSATGSAGHGLGRKFAVALNRNLNSIFADFGNERVTKGSHLEKLTLIRSGVGRDNVSDFTTNLIKEFLLDYTQTFTNKHIEPRVRRQFSVSRVVFNYKTESWEPRTYTLPVYRGEFVLLTPREILTRDDIWINRPDLFEDFESIAEALPNAQLRGHINNYLAKRLTEDSTKKERNAVIDELVHKHPELVEYYIKFKEDHGDRAARRSAEIVDHSEQLYVKQFGEFINLLNNETDFYKIRGRTLTETRSRVEYMKDVIENKGGWRLFYANGRPFRGEEDLQILFRFTWLGTPSDVTREADDGRGPVDYKVSRGSRGKTLVEFKLASNRQLKRNLRKQLEVYKKASDAEHGLKVILYFTEAELEKVGRILKELKMTGDGNIVLINARNDDKPSGSRA